MMRAIKKISGFSKDFPMYYFHWVRGKGVLKVHPHFSAYMGTISPEDVALFNYLQTTLLRHYEVT